MNPAPDTQRQHPKLTMGMTLSRALNDAQRSATRTATGLAKLMGGAAVGSGKEGAAAAAVRSANAMSSSRCGFPQLKQKRARSGSSVPQVQIRAMRLQFASGSPMLA